MKHAKVLNNDVLGVAVQWH